MSAIPMNVLMLGSDFQYPFSPLGADVMSVPLATYQDAIDKNSWPWPGWSAKPDSTGGVAMDTTGTRVVLTKASSGGVDIGNIGTTLLDTISNIFGKPKTVVQQSAPAKTDYTSYLIIGAAALAAIFLMKGTRK